MKVLKEKDKKILSKIKEEWKKLEYGRIFCDKRKTFYRVKFYMLTKLQANKAKKITEKYSIQSVVERCPCYFSKNKFNCIIKLEY